MGPGCITKGDTNIGARKPSKAGASTTTPQLDAGEDASTSSDEAMDDEVDTEPSTDTRDDEPVSTSNPTATETSGPPPDEPEGSDESDEEPPEPQSTESEESADEEPEPGAKLGFDLGPSVIALGSDHTCGTMANGAVMCWGGGSNGELGLDGTPNKSIPTSVPEVGDAVAITAGSSHTCVLKEDAQVTCWGQGTSGQLGLGDYDARYVPADPVELDDVVAIDAGGAHTCALTLDGKVYCWGSGEYGQLGDGRSSLDAAGTVKSSSPKLVEDVSNIESISTGQYTTCAVDADGAAWCWGDNSTYGLASPSAVGGYVVAPLQLDGLGAVQQVALGSTHACALLRNKSIKCWGNPAPFGNAYSSDGSPYIDIGISNAVRVVVGENFTCALLSSGAVRCMGDNTYGQLGNGSDMLGDAIEGGAIHLSAKGVSGSLHVCALLDTGKAKCWGYGASGQLGSGGTATTNSTPQSMTKYSAF
jgi:hypothetical protein